MSGAEAGPTVAVQAGITYEQFLDNQAQEAAIKRLNTVEEVAAMATLLRARSAVVIPALINVGGGTWQW